MTRTPPPTGETPEQRKQRRQLAESELYRRIAPWLTIAIGIVAATGVTVAAIASVQSANASAEARGSSRTTAVLVECLNRYADASSSTSKAVRDATTARDNATTARDHALGDEGVAFLDLVLALKAEKYRPAILDRLADTLVARAAAASDLAEAQAKLEAVKAANPVPAPPVVFCKLTDPDADTSPLPSATPSAT